MTNKYKHNMYGTLISYDFLLYHVNLLWFSVFLYNPLIVFKIYTQPPVVNK